MQTAIRRMHPDITNLSLLFFKQLFRLRTFHSSQSYLVAQLVNNPPAMQETRVWSLGWEDPLEKELGISFFSNSWEGKKQKQKQKTLQYSCLENFMDREAWWDRRVRQDWGTDTFTFIVHSVQEQRDGGIEDLIALTIQTSVGKVMSLLFNMLFVFVIGIVWVSSHMKAKMNIYDLHLKNDSVVFLV